MWIEENINNYMKVAYKIKKTLFSEKSLYQQIDVVDTEGFGRMLFNDHIAMLSERDEFIYHEMITHVPLFTHPNPREVLVIGGGDGGTVREILKHESVENVTLVEIDEMVVEVCKKFLPSVSSELSNPRCIVKIADGAKYVKETDKKYDIVIIDSTDPIGPSKPLFNEGFYDDVRSLLKEDGICVSQAESPYYLADEFSSLVNIKKNVFDQVFVYKYSNLTYPGGMWCFTFATSTHSPLSVNFDKRAVLDKMSLRYYSKSVHESAFVLPLFLENEPFLINNFS